MTHDQVKILLNDYFDEKLSIETNRSIEVHLSECPDCSQYLFSLQDLMKSAENLPRKIKPKTNFWDDIFNVISNIKSESIKQKEEIDSIEAERLAKQEEIQQKKNKKVDDKLKILQKEKRKAAIKEKLNKPIYRYALIGIVSIGILYFAYNFFFAKSEAWQVDKFIADNSFSEAYAKLSDDDIAESEISNRLEVQIPEIGNILLEPNSKIKRLSSNSVLLLQGNIIVTKNDAKEFLSVQVPGATIKDFFLNGKYRISLSSNNFTKLEVTDGWVSVTKGNLESRVLPSHICEIRADSGIGVPYNNSSPMEFINSVNNYSFTSNNSEESLVALLSKANASNAVTLWNLLSRTNLKQREMVMFTMFNLIGQPIEVTDEGLKMLKKEVLQKFLEDIETNI